MNSPTTRRGHAPQPGGPGSHGIRERTGSRTIRRVRQQPIWADLTDAAAMVALTIIAFLGFDDTYAGKQYLVVAVAGVLLGGLISYAAHLLRQPIFVLAAVGVVTFFLLGGAIALRGVSGASVLPTGRTVRELTYQTVHGWKDLLTTVPPVDGSGALLALPYLLGLFAGLCGVALATRTKAAFAPAIVPVLALAAVILLGNERIPAIAVRSALFAAVTLAWGCLRSARHRPVLHNGAGRLTRVATAAGALTVAGLVAGALGPHVPGTGSHARLLLRNYVSPPFNVGDYPSPLAEYQRYVQCDPHAQVRLPGDPLFTLSGNFPAGTAITFAALDTYNGSVWRASNVPGDRGLTPNTFLKVGPALDNPAPGPASTLTLTIPGNSAAAYHDYWMPSAGAVQGVRFHGPDARTDSRDFRYDLATRTGVVPRSLGPGDSYTLRVADTVPATLTPSDALNTGALGSPQPSSIAEAAAKAAQTLAGETDIAAVPAARILAMGAALRQQGKLTDCRNDFAYYLAGHSAGRLDAYANGLGGGSNPRYYGDNEQSAAFYALMIVSLGVPARVVVGVDDPAAVVPGHTVTTKDVSAWVEVEAADGRTWLTVPASMFNPVTRPVDQPKQQPQPQQPAGKVVPPPAQGRPKSGLDDSNVANAATTIPHSRGVTHGWVLPGWVVAVGKWTGPPIGVIALICLLVLSAKSVRRTRRRTRGSPAERLAHGWREILDHARDMGALVVDGHTRREHARDLHALGITGLAHRADAAIFGPSDPTEHDAGEYWNQVLEARRGMVAGLSRVRRIRIALSPASLRSRAAAK